ncbi:hypothetical protein HOY80DRAFT_883860, partial [Tuber brumale]
LYVAMSKYVKVSESHEVGTDGNGAPRLYLAAKNGRAKNIVPGSGWIMDMVRE